MLTVLIDAVGCPVVSLTVYLFKSSGVLILFLCDTAHRIERAATATLMFNKGVDSVSFTLINRIQSRDIVVSLNCSLTSTYLARRTWMLNQSNLEYTNNNIETLLERC